MIENHLVTSYTQKTTKRNKALNSVEHEKNKCVNINDKSIIENKQVEKLTKLVAGEVVRSQN